MTVTIKDVAKLANVAPSTVSRVIANNSRISEKTKRRVRKAIDELGYHPNLNARSLANQMTNSIGIIMPDSASKSFQNPFFPEVIRGIGSYIQAKEYSMLLLTGETQEAIYEGTVKMVQGRRVDGIILLYSRIDDKIIQYLEDVKFPFVVIGKPQQTPQDITYIDNDNYSAGREVTDYLINLGHKRIAFIGGNPNLMVTKERLLGYKEALKIADLIISEDYICHMEFLQEGGKEAVERLIQLKQPPTAIVVTDDLMAIGVLSALSEKGYSVPEDVSIVSFNNVIYSEISNPPLTSVDIRIFQLGYESAKSLVEKVETPELLPKSIIVPHTIVKRQSCKQFS
jgi:DNA-binding LacI/PurR family transcriptional regulator